ncbi:hypothetical protein PR202_gb02458 [Eleusine coracana subsp. coracana]|uniref:Bifunctional inhibitor/plant lipid transfer protein/seed storage helical domain-containing protein n=1 Tax=Eleusine coracana subsp. coracana TaxID=191504 RepID=A0AAV5DZB3_ELECO|nr:hypothetical protein PR202_gb02458 [Eleusine coracana subsp. coracana]
MEEVLLDRYVVRIVDELVHEIQRGGAPPLSETLDTILDGIPASLSKDEWEDARQQAMEAEMLRYRTEVEEPAAAILRERKAARPSAVKKVEVAFTGVNIDAAFYREVLDGIEPKLEVVEAPGLSSVALCVSWPAGLSPASSRASTTTWHPGPPTRSPMAALARVSPSYATVSPATTCSLSFSSVVNKAELFLWWSSGLYAGRWIQKKVKLPLPSESKEHSSRRTTSSMPIPCLQLEAVDSAGSICSRESLICDDLSAACPRFRFIPLPKECVIDLGHQSRGVPREYRSVMSSPELPDGIVRIRFLTMDCQGKVQSVGDVTLTIWTIQIRCKCKTEGWQQPEWVKVPQLASGGLEELYVKPIMPIISTVKESTVYLSFYRPLEVDPTRYDKQIQYNDCFGFVYDYPWDLPTTGPCLFKLELDIQSTEMLVWRDEVQDIPPPPPPPPCIFATDFNKMRGDWTAAKVERVEEEGDLRNHGKCVVEDDLESDEESDDKLPLLRPNVWPSPLRGVSAPGRSVPPPPGELLLCVCIASEHNDAAKRRFLDTIAVYAIQLSNERLFHSRQKAVSGGSHRKAGGALAHPCRAQSMLPRAASNTPIEHQREEGMAPMKAILAACVVLLVLGGAAAQGSGGQCVPQLNRLLACRAYAVPAAPDPSPDCCAALSSVSHDCACSTMGIINSLPSRCNVAQVNCAA